MRAPRRSREPARQRVPTSAPRERRSESPSPRSSPRAHAARTRGARPRTHTRCTLTVSRAPPLCQGTTGSRHPRGPHPVHQTSAPCSSAQGSPASGGRGVTEAAHPVGRLGRGPQHRTGTARPGPDTRQGGRGGAATRAGTRDQLLGHPPAPHYHHLFCSTKGCRRNHRPHATYQGLTASPPPPCQGPRSRRQGRERCRAAAPRSGQRPLG